MRSAITIDDKSARAFHAFRRFVVTMQKPALADSFHTAPPTRVTTMRAPSAGTPLVVVTSVKSPPGV